MLGIGAAGLALHEAIPFNRVWSIPSTVKPVNVWYQESFVRTFDPKTFTTRFDMMYGFGNLDPLKQEIEEKYIRSAIESILCDWEKDMESFKGDRWTELVLDPTMEASVKRNEEAALRHWKALN